MPAAIPRRVRRRSLRVLALLAATLAELAVSRAGWTLEARKPLGDFGIASWIDELPQATVPSVYQTRDGYLWVGTFEGLVRFDGATFTTFDLTALAGTGSHGAMAMYESRSGALWIGTNGSGLVRYQDGAFHLYTTKDGLADNFVLALQEDREDPLWVGPTRASRIGWVRRFETIDPMAPAAEGAVAIAPARSRSIARAACGWRRRWACWCGATASSNA